MYDETTVYHCRTCDSSEKESSDKNYICEGCLFPHLKQKHNVLDNKGYPPAVCERHRLLATYFCYDCENIFCLRDLEDHCQHKYKSVAERALEVKKTVFEYLNKFDEISKPLAVRKNLAQSNLKKNKDLYPNLGNDSFIHNLCSRFDRILRRDSPKWIKLAEENFRKAEMDDPCFNLSERVDNEVTNLRKLLTVSDGVCVSRFLATKNNFDSSLAEQKSELETHAVAEWCDDFDRQIERLIIYLLESWKISGLARFKWQTLECIPEGPSFACSENELNYGVFNLSIQGNRFTFLYFQSDQPQSASLRLSSASLVAKVRRSMYFSDGIKSVSKCRNFVAFQEQHSVVEFYDLCDNSDSDCRDIQDIRDLLKFEDTDGENFTLICWNSTKRAIECLIEDNVNWEVPVRSKPKLYSSNGTIIAFVDDDNNLTLYNLVSNLKVDVPSQNHCFARIDNLVIEESLCALFDYHSKTVLLSSFSLTCGVKLKWTIEKLFKIACTEEILFMSFSGERILVCADTKVYRSMIPQ